MFVFLNGSYLYLPKCLVQRGWTVDDINLLRLRIGSLVMNNTASGQLMHIGSACVVGDRAAITPVHGVKDIPSGTLLEIHFHPRNSQPIVIVIKVCYCPFLLFFHENDPRFHYVECSVF